MLVHHVATLTLMGLSLEFNFLRVGAAIMALHDASDIFLEARGGAGEGEGGVVFFFCGVVPSCAANLAGRWVPSILLSPSVGAPSSRPSPSLPRPSGGQAVPL